jgi:hypothetical protein
VERRFLAQVEHPIIIKIYNFVQHPDRRFGPAAEMLDQLTAVPREVLAAEDGQLRPGLSTLFSLERDVFGVDTTIWPGPPTPAAVVAALLCRNWAPPTRRPASWQPRPPPILHS